MQIIAFINNLMIKSIKKEPNDEFILDSDTNKSSNDDSNGVISKTNH
jgi:hypothetical protein